jgi:hypothetical protein
MNMIVIPLMMEAVTSSETSVSVYHTTRFYIPEECRLHGNDPEGS